MKNICSSLLVVFISMYSYGQHSLQKLWQTDSVLQAPESVRYSPKEKILYVSNIGNWDKEGTGFISKIGLDGKMIKRDWVTGLTATKGLGLYNNLLYAAEQSTVAIIDVEKGIIIQRIAIGDAKLLNDVTVDDQGIVYVSDAQTGKVHRIENGKASVFLENLKDVNGLLVKGGDLFILTDGKLQKANASKELKTIAQGIEAGADGIEMLGDDAFIVTGWGGTIYHIKSDGTKQLLLDTRSQKMSAADLGFEPSTNTVYIPAMSKNLVTAYKFN